MSSTSDELVELREHFRRGDRIIAVHYACENLYEATDHPAAVSCVAFCPVGSGNAVSFSQIDTASAGDESGARERWVLDRYFEYLQHNPSAAFVHWNMSKADYGFSALEGRYRYMVHDEVPYGLPEDRTFDVDDLVAAEHGLGYVRHPRLFKLAATNGLRREHALAGKDEADRFGTGDHGSIRRSTDEKVHWISELARRFLGGSLVTSRSVGSVAFADSFFDAVQAVTALAHRMRYVERELLHRHGQRDTLKVTDEYDAQDLLRSLLRVFFDDVRSEDYVPSYAGSNTRVDFVIPRFNLAIELKHSRASMTEATLGDELLADVARYGSRSDVRHLVCIVFDYQGDLRNPRGLEADLGRASSDDGMGVTVLVLDR